MDRRILGRSSCLCVGLLVLLASVAGAQNNIISTVAGGGPNKLAATSSAIGTPWKVVQQPGNANNFFVSDPFTNRVFEVKSGTLTVVAGNILAGYTLDGQAATVATLNKQQGIAVDSSGDLFIADTGNNVIRVVDTSGNIHTLAGNTNGQPCNGPPACGDGSPAAQATFNAPSDVAVDSTGNVYIADTVDNVIRVINTGSSQITIAGVTVPAGDIARVAGASTYASCSAPPSCGDGGLATVAHLNGPKGVWLDSQNNIYISDTADDAIRVVNTQASQITVAGVTIQPNNIAAIAGTYAPCTQSGCGDTGAATSAQLTQPDAAAADSNGNVYIADTNDQVVRIVNGTNESNPGTINLLAGAYNTTCNVFPCGDGGAANAALLSAPSGVLVDNSNNLYIADQTDDSIREIKAPISATNDIETTFGIILNVGYSGDGNPATDASLQSPSGTATDPAGNVYIADALNNVLRVVNKQSSSIKIAGVTVAPGNIATIAGTGSRCNTQNCGDGGAATAAQLSGPSAVALDASGNIYVDDALDSAIRVINTQASAITINGFAVSPGNIQTLAGNGTPGYGGDNGPASLAVFNAPFGVALDKSGNIYVADGTLITTGPASNNVIRVINTQSSAIKVAGVTIPAGFINTVAGTVGATCSPSTDPCGDGGSATGANAALTTPTGLAVDGSGNIYIADFGDNRIRLVTNSSGLISTVAGTGTACPSAPCGDGSPATQATLDAPFDVFVDFANNVYVGDLEDSVVRSFPIGGKISTVAGSYAYGFFGDGSAATSAALAQPAGVGADLEGNLFVTDLAAFRVREVTRLVTTAPTATLSSNPLVFPATILGDNNQATLTITNNGNGTNLTISSITISGTNSGDFKETNKNCTTVPPNGGTPCTVTVTFTPDAAGARSATLTIIDNASNSPQLVTLSGTGVATLQANPTSRTVSAGGSADYTITVPSQGFTGNMTLSCPAGLPTGAACTFSPATVAPGKTSTLTITTTAPSSSMLAPQNKRAATPFYAIWLLLPAMFLSTAGMSAANRKKLISYLLLTLAMMGVLFLVACGGGSSTSGGGGGGGGTPTGGTPSGSYTITVQGVAGSTTATQKVTLTVQ